VVRASRKAALAGWQAMGGISLGDPAWRYVADAPPAAGSALARSARGLPGEGPGPPPWTPTRRSPDRR